VTRRTAVTTTLVLGLAYARAGHAETNSVMSEALFREAKRLTATGKYTEACPKLEESYRLDPGTGTLLNLAVCYEKTGRTAKAWAKFNEAASSARREGRADRLKMATEHAKALEPILSRLVVSVAPAAEVSGLEVRVDDTVLGKASWGFAMPYDPGTHQVSASAPGKKPYKVPIFLEAKADRKEIVIRALAAEPPERVTSSEPSPLSPAKSNVAPPIAAAATIEAPGPSRVPMYLMVGLGVVGFGVGTYFGVEAISKRDASNRICPGTLCEDPAAVAKMELANRDAWISNVGIGVGIVGAGVATYLFFAARAARETKSAVSVVPVVGWRECGLSLSRTW
jgi:serine/threonine-protein kinase